MKQLIFSVVLLTSLSAYSQTTTFGGSSPAGASDPSASPGSGFGGAMGGANSTTAPTNIPSNTLPRNDQFGTSPSAIQNDQIRIQEQQERPIGSGGSGFNNNTTTPSIDGSLPGRVTPSPSSVTPAPGAGTVTPTSPGSVRGY